MPSSETRPRRVIRLSLKKIIWIIVIVLVVLWLGRGFWSSSRMGFDATTVNKSYAPGVMMPRIDDDYYRGDYSQSDISDTREFLKTSYYGQIQTRRVAEIVDDVKNEVRDVEGRVDSLSSSEKYGSISFVVPKSRFEEFRIGVEALTHRKLYAEDISSDNLLNQKQNLEQRTGVSVESLATLDKAK